MCTKENLTVYNLGISTVLMLSSAILTLLGFLMILNDDWNLAYSGTPKAWGGSSLVTAALLTFGACTGFYGTKRHNKCFLALSTLVLCGCIMMEYSVAQNVVIWINPNYEDSEIQACVEPGDASMFRTPECDELLGSRDMLAMARLWMQIYKESLEDERRKATLVDIENEQYCCGIGPAAQCQGEIVTGLGTNYTLWGDEVLNAENPIMYQAGRCSARVPVVWYTQSFYCQVQAGDEFGCPYMYSTSTSCLRDVNTRKGCLSAFQKQIEGRVRPVATTMWVLLSIQGTAVLSTCCLFLKRKANDVLPPPAPFVDKRFLKYAAAKEPNSDRPQLQSVVATDATDETQGAAD